MLSPLACKNIGSRYTYPYQKNWTNENQCLFMDPSETGCKANQILEI